MKLNVRKVLLAGSAIVAVSAISTQANAAPFTHTAAAIASGATGTWAQTTAGVQGNATSADIAHAGHGDSVNLNAGATLTVTNNGTADDGSANANTFDLGAVTNTAGTGNFTVVNGTNNALVVTGTSLSVGSAIAFNGANFAAGAQTDTFTGNVSAGTTFAVDNSAQNAGAMALAVNVGGTLTVGTTTAITGGAFAGAATAALTVGGNTSFGGAVTVTAGANAAAIASLNLNGASNTFTGGLNLVTAAKSKLNLGGTVAQTVTGNITGAGDIVVNNAAGATFNGTVTIGTITIEKTAGNSSATFTKAVTATSIKLGGDAHAGDVNAVTFDSTGGNFTVAGTLAGTATETDNVSIVGGHTITQTGAWGGTAIDTLAISGSGTILDSDSTIAATNLTVGNGAKIDIGAGAATVTTTTLTGTGTVLLSAGGGISGTVDGNTDGAGVLDVDASATVGGNIGTIHDLSSIDIAQGAVLTASGNVEANTVNFSGTTTGTLGMVGGKNLTGNVTTTATGNGTITITDVAATTAIAGNIGTDGKRLAALTVANGGALANVVTTTGNLYVNAITQGSVDTLKFIGDGTAQVVSGTVGGGIITVGSSATSATDVTFNGAVTAVSGSTTAVAKATFDATSTFSGAFNNDGTVQVNGGHTGSNTNRVLTVSDFTDATVGTYNIGVNNVGGTQTYGQIVESADNNDLANDTIHFVVGGDRALQLGNLNNVFAGNADAVIIGATVTDNSFLYGFTLVNDTANDAVDVTVAQEHSFDDAAGDSGNGEAAEVILTDLAASTNPEISAIRGNLIAASSQDEVEDIIASIQPDVGGGATVGAMTMTDLSLGVSNDRLAMLRSGDNSTGMATGNVSQGLRMWGQVYGSHANQDERDGVNGYDADTFGGAVGLDTENAMNDHSVVGVALSYGNTSVDNEGLGSNEADVDSYQFTLYGDMDLGNAMYLNGQLAYAWGNTETDRHDIGGVSGLDAHGEYDSATYAARAELGKDYQYDKATITPHVMGNWVHFDPDSYDETGAGGANLHVAGDSLDIIEAGLGADVSWMYQNGDGSYIEPKLSAGYRYNFGDDQVETTSTFAGGGDSFRTQGADPASSRFNVGASIRYFSTDNWDLTAGYNYDFREDYGAHSGMVRAAYKF